MIPGSSYAEGMIGKIEKLIELEESYNKYVETGNVYYNNGNYLKAAKEYSDALKIKSDDPVIVAKT